MEPPLRNSFFIVKMPPPSRSSSAHNQWLADRALASVSGCRRAIFPATVLHNRRLCDEHYELSLAVRPGVSSESTSAALGPTAPGQFFQVQAGPAASVDPDFSDRVIEWPDGSRPEIGELRQGDDEFASSLALLRRPLSITRRTDTDDGPVLDFIYRVTGKGTQWLERLTAGATVSLLGPLGEPYVRPDEKQIVLLVGGGVGIPPMMYMAQRLARPRVIAFCGATTRRLLPLTVTDDAPAPSSRQVSPLYNIDEFARAGVPAVVSTDDGSYGFHGYVTQALAAYLDQFFADSWDQASPRPVVYTCGSEPMMKSVAGLCEARSLTCYASMERAMACGMGTCQSCVVRVASDNPRYEGWRYALSCTEGPTFRTDTLLW